jgi:hypothetical protein
VTQTSSKLALLVPLLLCTAARAEVVAPTLFYNISSLEVALDWAQASPNESYNLYYTPYPYEPGNTIEKISLGTTSKFSAELWDGASFYVAVTSIVNGEESGYSNILHIETSTLSPARLEVAYFDVDDSTNYQFLGCFTCDRFHLESIHNDYGRYGHQESPVSIRNKQSEFGSLFSQKSSCNVFASSPPWLYEIHEGGVGSTYAGEFSVNKFSTHSICNPASVYYFKDACALLNIDCAD